MFVRRQVKADGTNIITIVDKSTGKYKMFKYIGQSKDPLEADKMEMQARQMLSQMSDPELPLFSAGVDSAIMDFVESSEKNNLQMVGPEIVYGSIYDSLGYGALKNVMLRSMVVSRCFSGGSAMDTVDYLSQYTKNDYPLSDVYSTLDAVCYRSKEDLKDTARLALERVNLTKPNKEQQYYLFVDFLPYEDPTLDQLALLKRKKVPASSPMKVCLLVLVDSTGSPVGYDTCTAAALKGKRLYSLASSLVKRYSLEMDWLTIVAGTDILSKAVIEVFEKKNIKYLMSTGLKHGSVSDDQSSLMARNASLAAQDAKKRELALEKLQKKIDLGQVTPANINNKGNNRFLKLEGDKIVIDTEKVAQESKLDGMQVYSSNLDCSSDEILSLYATLDKVKGAFCMNRADLLFRPVIHRAKNRIEGHICLCFMAYAISCKLESLLSKEGISMAEAKDAITNMLQLDYTVQENDRRKRTLVRMDSVQKKLYELSYNLK